MPTEADTCRTLITPWLQAVGWDTAPHSIAEQNEQTAFFGYFAPEARELLNDLLEKYATDRKLQFTLPDVLRVPPISQHGNVAEIAQLFGGFEKLGTAVNQLQSLLYAA